MSDYITLPREQALEMALVLLRSAGRDKFVENIVLDGAAWGLSEKDSLIAATLMQPLFQHLIENASQREAFSLYLLKEGFYSEQRVGPYPVESAHNFLWLIDKPRGTIGDGQVRQATYMDLIDTRTMSNARKVNPGMQTLNTILGYRDLPPLWNGAKRKLEELDDRMVKFVQHELHKRWRTKAGPMS